MIDINFIKEEELEAEALQAQEEEDEDEDEDDNDDGILDDGIHYAEDEEEELETDAPEA